MFTVGRLLDTELTGTFCLCALIIPLLSNLVEIGLSISWSDDII